MASETQIPAAGRLGGIVPPLVTPLKHDDELDQRGLENLIEHVIGGGVSGIFVLGTTGEGPALSYRLRQELLEAAGAQIAGRVPLLAGVTDTAYRETIILAERAERAGAAAAVVAPPYYFAYSQRDLLHYIERLSADLPLPFYLYNMPQLTKVSYEIDTVCAAAQIPRVLGLKDSSGDLAYLASVVKAVSGRPDFAVLIGPEEKLADAMKLGAHGGVCGGANLQPELFVQLFEAAARGDYRQAAELQSIVLAFSDALYTVGDPASSYLRGLKAALEASELCSGGMAMPLSPFNADEKQLIRERLADVSARFTWASGERIV